MSLTDEVLAAVAGVAALLAAGFFTASVLLLLWSMHPVLAGACAVGFGVSAFTAVGVALYLVRKQAARILG